MYFPRCVRPLYLLHPADKLRVITVPCGKCIACRLRYASSWAMRSMMEYKSVGSGCFLTLTYDEEHNPVDLRKRDLQLFFKRFRHTVGRYRYLACGEYGEQSLRPHYHILLFGVDIEHPVFALWHAQGTGRAGHLADWPYGECFVGSVTEQSCLYVCKYAVKSYHKLVAGLEPPFLLMSRRPGLGYSYIMSHGRSLRSGVDAVVRYRGKYQPTLPGYVRDKLDELDLMVDFDLTPVRQERNKEIETECLKLRYQHDLLSACPPGELPERYERRLNTQRGYDLSSRSGG